MRILNSGLALAAAAALAIFVAPASARAAPGAPITGTAKGVSIAVRSVKGTECAPQGWLQPGSAPCHLLVHGTWSGTSQQAGPLHGRYTGRLTIHTAQHAPGCLETSGTLTYTARAASGKPVGRIVVLLDPSDSEVCKHQLPTRRYFFRADPQVATGVFAGFFNWLVEGSGQPRHGHAYVDELSVSGE